MGIELILMAFKKNDKSRKSKDVKVSNYECKIKNLNRIFAFSCK